MTKDTMTLYDLAKQYEAAYDTWHRTTDWRTYMSAYPHYLQLGLKTFDDTRVKKETKAALSPELGERYIKLRADLNVFNTEINRLCEEQRQAMFKAQDALLTACFPKDHKGRHTGYDNHSYTDGAFLVTSFSKIHIDDKTKHASFSMNLQHPCPFSNSYAYLHIKGKGDEAFLTTQDDCY